MCINSTIICNRDYIKHKALSGLGFMLMLPSPKYLIIYAAILKYILH